MGGAKIARILGLAVLTVGAMVAMPQSAKAWYEICNKSSYDIYAAFGYHDGAAWVSEGWWDLSPGECATVYEPALIDRKYYVYAESHAQDYFWDGDYPFCASDDEFTIVGDKNCQSRGYYEIGFFEVDIGKAGHDAGFWTTDLTD